MPRKKVQFYSLDMSADVLDLPSDIAFWFKSRYQGFTIDDLLTFNTNCLDTFCGFTPEQKREVERVINEFWKGAEKGEYKIFPTEKDHEKRFRRPMNVFSNDYPRTSAQGKHLWTVLSPVAQRLICGGSLDKAGKKTLPLDYKGLLDTPGYGITSARNTILFYSARENLHVREECTGYLSANISVMDMEISYRAMQFLTVNQIEDLYTLDVEQEYLEDIGAGPWIAKEIRSYLNETLYETEGIPQTKESLANAYYQKFGFSLTYSQWKDIVEQVAKNRRSCLLDRSFISLFHRDEAFMRGATEDLKERLERTRTVMDREAVQELYPEFLKQEKMREAFNSLTLALFHGTKLRDDYPITNIGGYLAPKDISMEEYYCSVYPDDAETFRKCVKSKNSTQELQRLGVTKHKAEVVKTRLREAFGENRKSLHFQEEHALYFARTYHTTRENIMDLFHLTEEECTAVMMVIRRSERGNEGMTLATKDQRVPPSVRKKIISKYL